MNDIVRAAKILGACMVIAAGMLGYAIAESIRVIGPNGSGLPVLGTLLGLCLLFTAWIERNPISWLVLQWKRWLEYNNPPPLRQETPSESNADTAQTPPV